MLKKDELRIFIADGKTLEFLEMQRFLSRQGYCFEIVDLYCPEFIERLPELAAEKIVMLVGWNLSVKRNGIAKVSIGKDRTTINLPLDSIILSEIPNKCLYRQLLSFLHIVPTEYQKKIIANAEGGIEGLYKLHFRKSEIEKIRKQELRLLGLKPKDWKVLEEDFAKAKIKGGLYEVELQKPAFIQAALDEAYIRSFGRPRKLDVFASFRNGAQSYYMGRSEIAYDLFEKFRGIYSGDYDWTGYTETVDEVREFLYSLYETK